MADRFSRAHWAHWAAAALILLAVVNQLLWLSQASAVETWDDDAGLFRFATCLEDQLRGGGDACLSGAPYPPLIPAIAAAHFLISGARGVDIALLSLWPWTVLLGVSLWAGTRRAAGDWAGLAAVALGPVIVWSLHIRGKFYTEVPLAALVLAAIVAWVHCEGFRRRGPALALGLFIGLGLLTKWSFAFFLGPPMALAWAMGLAGPIRSRRLRVLMGAAVLGAVGLLASGATGRLMGGLLPGVGLGTLAAVGAVFLARSRPEAVEADGAGRWINMALTTAIILVIAGPWYLMHLGQLQAFLADNMAQKFHGDPIDVLAGESFYPAVLLTRMLGSPLALLLVLGTALALRPGHPALPRWSLLSLVAGALILGALPYRSGRYLVAGLGLVTPVILIGLARLPRVGKASMIVLLVSGIAHQLSWIPLASGTVHIPHHWPIFSLPEQDLFGNSAQGIATARSDLLRPRWRFLPVASPPIARAVPARELVRAASADSPGPFLLVILDPAGRINTNSLQTELLSTRPSTLSGVTTGDVQPTPRSLAHWQHQARHPPDTPATAQGDTSRWLYIGTARPSDDPNHQSRVEDLVAMLSSQGWSEVMTLEIADPFEPTTVSVWAEPR